MLTENLMYYGKAWTLINGSIASPFFAQPFYKALLNKIFFYSYKFSKKKNILLLCDNSSL